MAAPSQAVGVGNPTFIGMMPAALLQKDRRFKRLGESEDGLVAEGGYGKVFKGFDELRQELVFIKRQNRGCEAAAREAACFSMLEAFPHPNILRMHGMWTGNFKEKTYFYIAMEACHTTLWKYIGVGNPIMTRNFKPFGRQQQPLCPQQLLIAIVRAVGHLHALGVTHGDVSLSNLLLTAAGEVRLGDFGTVTAHTFLTRAKLCVAYIRPPESTLGSDQKGTAVDAWAVALVALALWTGRVPTCAPRCTDAADSYRSEFALIEASKLLPAITEESWPGHSALPHWRYYQHRLRPGSGSLADYVDMHHQQGCQPRLATAFVELGFLWNPALRSSMDAMERYLQTNFPIQVQQPKGFQQGRQPTIVTANAPAGSTYHPFHDPPAELHRKRMRSKTTPHEAAPIPADCQSERKQHQQSPQSETLKRVRCNTPTNEAAPRPAGCQSEQIAHQQCRQGGVEASKNTLAAESAAPKRGCQPFCRCTGNCGLQPCTQRLNSRRSKDNKEQQICENQVDTNGQFCNRCRCEAEGCAMQRQYINRRFCTNHTKEFAMSDFVSPKGPGTFPTNASLEWRVFLRTNFLHSQLDPEDTIAFQEVCSEFNEPKAGRAMDPHGIVICVLAHALKWPPAVRHYQSTLRKLLAAQGCQPET